VKTILSNAGLSSEDAKAIEAIVVGALAEGRVVNRRGLAAMYNTSLMAISKIVSRVEAAYGQKSLRKTARKPGRPSEIFVVPSVEPETPSDLGSHLIPLAKAVEIGEFYEAGYPISELASSYGYPETDILEALHGLGAEAPEARNARLEYESELRRSEEEAWDEDDRRRGLAATAAAIERAAQKTPLDQPITPTPEPILASSPIGGPSFYHGLIWEVELAPLGTKYPALEYIRRLQAEKKLDEVAEFQRLVRDYANNGALPNMKFKAMIGAMAGFWELAFGRQRQQRVFTRVVSVLDRAGTETRVWVILNGFTKKTDATPQAEIDRAHKAYIDYVESLESGGRTLKKGSKKNPDDNLNAPDEDSRLRMSSGKLVEEYQLAIQAYMKRNAITSEILSKKLGVSEQELADVIDSPGGTLDDLVKVAFALGLQLHGHIGPLGY
jgi:phage-related protein